MEDTQDLVDDITRQLTESHNEGIALRMQIENMQVQNKKLETEQESLRNNLEGKC